MRLVARSQKERPGESEVTTKHWRLSLACSGSGTRQVGDASCLIAIGGNQNIALLMGDKNIVRIAHFGSTGGKEECQYASIPLLALS